MPLPVVEGEEGLPDSRGSQDERERDGVHPVLKRQCPLASSPAASWALSNNRFTNSLLPALRLSGGDSSVKRAETSPCPRQTLASRPAASPSPAVGQDLAEVMHAEAPLRGNLAAGAVISRRPHAPTGSPCSL